MASKTIAAALFVSWVVHDLEEIVLAPIEIEY